MIDFIETKSQRFYKFQGRKVNTLTDPYLVLYFSKILNIHPFEIISTIFELEKFSKSHFHYWKDFFASKRFLHRSIVDRVFLVAENIHVRVGTYAPRGGQILEIFEGGGHFSGENLGGVKFFEIFRGGKPNFCPFGGCKWGFSAVLRGVKSKNFPNRGG